MALNLKTVKADIEKVGSVVVADVHKVLTGFETVVEKLVSNPAVQATVQATITDLFGVNAGQLESVAFSVIQSIATAFKAGDAAAAAKLKDLGLNEDLISDIRQIVKQLETIKF